ncbi:hypothetical protein GCWU000324_00624 [Kingella oralis ATCC 51147]|uniref:Uncharacterized protein n=1 Tax=Kingella oralis ATCC 51147 TaxID=629741 RepID=C4GER5_9NEIS|nr:hypothetical protein GCWU000324_00624 [Kingella oralis ATCC 51147]
MRQPENIFRLESVFTICIGRFDDIKARIQGKKHSKVQGWTPCAHF